nr:hypothetical protein [Tanacetum cinerariifolium]
LLRGAEGSHHFRAKLLEQPLGQAGAVVGAAARIEQPEAAPVVHGQRQYVAVAGFVLLIAERLVAPAGYQHMLLATVRNI